MQKTQMLIQEIENLVCVEEIQEPSTFYVRIVDVLKKLQPYELTSAESVEDYLEHLDDLGYLEKVGVGNSYNWNAPLDHNFAYCIHHDQLNDRYLVEFAVHKYGDIRANYTNSVLYSFEHVDDFFAACATAGHYKKLGSYFLEACPLQEGWRVYNEEGEEVAQMFDEQDILEFVNS